MKFFPIFFLLSLLIYQNAHGEKTLSPPTGASQCAQAYESAGQNKTTSSVFNSLSSACYSAGGIRLTNKTMLSENSNEPSGILFTCTGSTNFVVFSCLFSTSLGDNNGAHL